MRTSEEIFQNHLEVFAAGDIEGILKDYSDDTVIIYRNESWLGLGGVRDFFRMWLEDLIPAGSRFDLIDQTVIDNMMYITWTAESKKYQFDYGTDTFIFKDGAVWRQTVATHHFEKSEVGLFGERN